MLTVQTAVPRSVLAHKHCLRPGVKLCHRDLSSLGQGNLNPAMSEPVCGEGRLERMQKDKHKARIQRCKRAGVGGEKWKEAQLSQK